MQKFETLWQPLLWFWIAVVTRRTRKQEKKKIPKKVATFVYARSQGQRTHSARTNIWTVYEVYNLDSSPDLEVLTAPAIKLKLKKEKQKEVLKDIR